MDVPTDQELHAALNYYHHLLQTQVRHAAPAAHTLAAAEKALQAQGHRYTTGHGERALRSVEARTSTIQECIDTLSRVLQRQDVRGPDDGGDEAEEEASLIRAVTQARLRDMAALKGEIAEQRHELSRMGEQLREIEVVCEDAMVAGGRDVYREMVGRKSVHMDQMVAFGKMIEAFEGLKVVVEAVVQGTRVVVAADEEGEQMEKGGPEPSNPML